MFKYIRKFKVRDIFQCTVKPVKGDSKKWSLYSSGRYSLVKLLVGGTKCGLYTQLVVNTVLNLLNDLYNRLTTEFLLLLS